jgi:hypothetical protein
MGPKSGEKAGNSKSKVHKPGPNERLRIKAEKARLAKMEVQHQQESSQSGDVSPEKLQEFIKVMNEKAPMGKKEPELDPC